ncbi:MAG: TIGR00282 family metallophosphoesterase [Nitrospiraceae bacterium]|nr:TIGR00282 family metallophosphoesterase [Nitrospiraceae bacterium]
MKILFVGDIVGRPGRRILSANLPHLREEHALDAVVVNAENAAGGLGVTPHILDEMTTLDIDGITLGNHTWRKRELAGELDRFDSVARPANYVPGLPGRGSVIVRLADGRRFGLICVVGRVFMEPFRCPFAVAQQEVARLREATPVVLVDIHAEATSEKMAMGWHLDGQCAAVLGTHTHVQTADERLLPKGTAYITDVGMTGPYDSVIGLEPERAVKKFLTGMPNEYRLANGPVCLNAVVVDVDEETGLANSIRRVAHVAE